MTVLATALTAARWMAYVGFACGVIYSVGGLILDLTTIGLNRGTALAFLALIGMPVLFAAFGFLVGALFAMARGATRSATRH